ncbi:MAG: tryptophan 7-halogenase, partial [Marinicaulis sp.]|nr:tryptophan 7-halogenase [Marinicaulis sp.]
TQQLKITVIESPDVGIIGVGESTARPMSDLLRILGVPESEFIKRCNATFKLGGLFTNWDFDTNGKPITWVNPFFSQTDINGFNPAAAFASFAMDQNGEPTGEDFTEAISVCPEMIRGRRGPRAIGAQDYQSDIPYSYHMDAVELAAILMEQGKRLGVRQILDHVNDVKLDERGYVSDLTLKENGDYPVEFIIDATGFASIIIGKALGEPFEPYKKYLLNDRAAVAQLPHEDPTKIEPTSRATGMNAGWSFRVPLFNRVGSGYIYSSDFISDDEAIAEFKALAGDAAKGAEPRVIRMRIGKTRRSWVKNCVALGLSSGFVEPLEATAIYSVHVALQWLVSYFPDSDFDPAVAARYNKMIDGLYNEIIDFIALLFCTGNREDTPYWQAVHNDMEIPPRLKENLELWRSTFPDDLDLGTRTFFTPTSYRSALMGKRFFKGGDNMQAAALGETNWKKYLELRKQRTQGLLQKLPDHYELLKNIRGEGDKSPIAFQSFSLTHGGFN